MAGKLPPVKELRGLPGGDLQAQLDKCRQELWQARVNASDGSLQQTHQLGLLRRQIARLFTILKQQHATAPQKAGKSA